MFSFAILGGSFTMYQNRKSTGVLLLLITLAFVVAVSGCTPQNPTKNQATAPFKESEFLLDTFCDITVYDSLPKEVTDKGFEKIKEVDRKMDVNDADSEVSQVNKNAGVAPVKVSDETYYVIKTGKGYGDITHGKFDITVGPLVKLWGINTDHARIPSPEEIKTSLALINYKNVVLDDAKKEILLKNSGMSLDLGGIAKGFAADEAAAALKANGVQHAIINLGGNVLVVGSKPDGTPWKIGVQNPVSPRGEYLGVIEATDEAIVTSGIYERYFEKDGKRYHHIMDTATGYPVDNGLASVSIITKRSIDGDALAKAFCMGLEGGMAFIEQKEGVEAIFVTTDSKVYVTPGLKNRFMVTDASFTLMN
jgi:thiamine biosynthesis lipoprotein